LNIYKFDIQNLSEEELNQKDNLQYLSHLLFEIGITTGSLICNSCGREYKITDGIPNLVLNDDEI
jgi:uncharacterized protein YbaR (Trm112 family)